jgi:hypothetical protein
METSIFAFATDLRDEGVEEVLDRLQRAGLGGITLAVSYHHGRDIFPHNPLRKVHFLEGGALFFRPDPRRYENLRIQPHVSRLAQEGDMLAELRRSADRRSMQVHAWTVFLHNSTLGQLYADCTPENAFGDRYLTELCPANPNVGAYVRALCADIAAHEANSIVSESLHYHPLEHGFHHERYFIDLGARSRYLLGLCFCRHCRSAASARGVNADGVRALVREELERVFEGSAEDPSEEIDRDEIGAMAGGEMAGYMEARQHRVTTLVAEAADAVAGTRTRFTFMDLSGAVKGYATGQPTGDAAPTIAWKLGVDLSGVAGACDGLEAIGYAFEPDRLRFDLEAYRAFLPPDGALMSALRPMKPDCDGPQNLARKLEAARALGLARVDFYHYGFMRLAQLDWIGEALANA